MSENKKITLKNNSIAIPKSDDLITGYNQAIGLVDDLILKNYIINLSDLEIVPLSEELSYKNIEENVLFFKINEMVYEKDEFDAFKFASVFNSLASTKSSIFVIIDSDGIKTDFYMGVRSMDETKTTSSMKNTLENAMYGQFPGIKTTNYTIEDIKEILDQIDGSSISSVSCVANFKEENLNKNEEFVQGLEKLVLSMRGQKYTGIIIANTSDQNQLRSLRRDYENIYTMLSPFSTTQINYGQNSSIGKNKSKSFGRNESTTDTTSNSNTTGISETTSDSTSHSTSRDRTASRLVKGVGAATSIISAALFPAFGPFSLTVGGIVSGGLGLLGTAVSGTESDSTSNSYSKSTNESKTTSKSVGQTVGSSITYTSGESMTEGLSKALNLTAHNKPIEDILLRIDKQLKRMDEFESLGMYECAAYFLSDNQYASEMAASTYKAIVGGLNTGVEVSAINNWSNHNNKDTKLVEDYVKNLIHPIFKYKGPKGNIEVTPGSMVSGNELAIHMGLPRKSVCGLPVIEHSDFGKEVVNYNGKIADSGINLGKVFNMGSICPNNVYLDKNSLSMHTFVTGSTGSGKSNTIYELIRQSEYLGAKFMVIEPAKGEYKHIFGNRSDVNVFGSNPEYSELLRINPFKFSKGIHVLEHVDRLVEIFNVCWPMYAAMPAVLKEALLKSYENCGWDFSTSRNKYDDSLFPTFLDLEDELIEVITGSAYSEEVKSNYMGSLVTRIKSLTNGLNGKIFTSNEIDNKFLFDENVIIDLSRIGSLETKSLIMGLLIMRLNEYRMSTAESINVPFKHMTVLEEAHNILKRTSTEQSAESPSVLGKSVEMISNAIAEMRSYGEGFVIVDQSPSAVDVSAIRNTNTKIIMRLPDESDRRLAGKAAGLRDDQLDEIAKLPKGVAVVYQNDWIESVLCKIKKYKGTESKYKFEKVIKVDKATNRLKKNLLELCLQNRVNNPKQVDLNILKKDLINADISSKNKLKIKKIINEFESNNNLSIWEENNFENLSKVVSELINESIWFGSVLNNSSEFNLLTEKMMDSIDREVSGLSTEYKLAISQCIMRTEASKSESLRDIYSAWITNLKDKKVF